MKKLIEIAHSFFISVELAIVAVGVVAQLALTKSIANMLLGVHIPDDLFKWAIAIPGALLGWSLVSGRKVLFPDKDKANIIQKWSDYWRLKIYFHVTLAWNVVFLMISVYAWLYDWKVPSSSHFIALVVSILGSSTSSFSLYNAQTRVEEEMSQYKGVS